MAKTRDNPSFRVGFVIFVASLILVGAVFLLGTESALFGGRVHYVARFPRIGMLRSGASVYLGGVRVGSVSDIRFTEDPADTRIVVELAVERRFEHRIREGITCRIDSEGLLGDKNVCMFTDPERPLGKPIRYGGEIPAQTPTEMSEIIAGGERVMQSTSDLIELVSAILARVGQGEGTLGKLVTDTSLYDNLVRLAEPLRTATERASTLLGDLEAITRDLREGKGTAGRLLRSDDLAAQISKDLDRVSTTFVEEVQTFRRDAESALAVGRESLERISSRIEKLVAKAEEGEGSVALLLRERALYDDLRAAASEIRTAAERLGIGAGTLSDLAKAGREGEGVIARLFGDAGLSKHVAQTAASLDRSARRLESVLAKIDENRGSLGMLVNDPELAMGLRDVVEGIQQSGLLRRAVRSAERSGRERRIEREIQARLQPGLMPSEEMDVEPAPAPDPDKTGSDRAEGGGS